MRLIIYKIPEKEKVLYNIGQLLEKLCKQNKIGILCSEDVVGMIDDILWTFSTNIFLPHDIATGNEEIDSRQPIVISADMNWLNRKVLCLFTNEDLFKVLDKINVLDEVEHIVYMLQMKEENDIEKIIEKVKNNVNNICIDVYQKSNNRWVKI
jgi:DNA polymerase IIIc chi subunit